MRRNNKNIILSLNKKDNNINFELNNFLYKHFKNLNPMQQEIIKQTMKLKYNIMASKLLCNFSAIIHNIFKNLN